MDGTPGRDAAPGPVDGATRHYWDGVARQWQARHLDRLWRSWSDAIHIRWLERVAASVRGMRILKTDLFDEAFGHGLVAWFEARGNTVVACDLALLTASGAHGQQASVAAVTADVRGLPFPAGHFDCVLSDSTLDHFDSLLDLQESLRELSRVLRPGGTLLLTMDNPRNPIVWLRNLTPGFWMRTGLVPYMVGVTCSARTLTQLLAGAGFDVEAIGTIMHSPRVLCVLICRWLERRPAGGPEPSRWLAWVLHVEHLDRLPFHQLTGHFVAVRARRRA